MMQKERDREIEVSILYLLGNHVDLKTEIQNVDHQ